MIKKTSVLVFILAASIGACKSDKKEGGSTKSAPSQTIAAKKQSESKGAAASDPAREAKEQAYQVKAGKEHFEKAKAAFAAGEDAALSCQTAMGFLDEVKEQDGMKAVHAEAHKLCNYEVPVRQADAAIKLAEEVRKTKPNAKLVSECMSADYNLAMKRLGEHFADDEKVKALTARYEAACPQMVQK